MTTYTEQEYLKFAKQFTEQEVLDFIRKNISMYRKKTTLTREIVECPPMQKRSIGLVQLVLDAVFETATTKTVFELTGDNIRSNANGVITRTSMYRYFKSTEEMCIAAFNRDVIALKALFDEHKEIRLRISPKEMQNIKCEYFGQLLHIIESIKKYSTNTYAIVPMSISDGDL